MDNDLYGHVNNVVYYSYFDTVVNEYLIREGGLDIAAGGTIGLAVETFCQFHQPLAFPEVIDAGLRGGKARPLLGALRDRALPAGPRRTGRDRSLRARLRRSPDAHAG